MRRFVTLTTAATILSIAAIAFAAAERHATADLTSLAVAGLTGKAQLNERIQGTTNITIQFKGLQPGTEYAALYYGDGSCQVEATQNIVGRFIANPAGNATLTTKVEASLDLIRSISVALESSMAVQACGAVI